MVGNLTKKNKKCQMPGGAWAPLELTHTSSLLIVPFPPSRLLHFLLLPFPASLPPFLLFFLNLVLLFFLLFFILLLLLFLLLLYFYFFLLFLFFLFYLVVVVVVVVLLLLLLLLLLPSLDLYKLISTIETIADTKDTPITFP